MRRLVLKIQSGWDRDKVVNGQLSDIEERDFAGNQSIKKCAKSFANCGGNHPLDLS